MYNIILYPLTVKKSFVHLWKVRQWHAHTRTRSELEEFDLIARRNFLIKIDQVSIKIIYMLFINIKDW